MIAQQGKTTAWEHPYAAGWGGWPLPLCKGNCSGKPCQPQQREKGNSPGDQPTRRDSPAAVVTIDICPARTVVGMKGSTTDTGVVTSAVTAEGEWGVTGVLRLQCCMSSAVCQQDFKAGSGLSWRGCSAAVASTTCSAPLFSCSLPNLPWNQTVECCSVALVWLLWPFLLLQILVMSSELLQLGSSVYNNLLCKTYMYICRIYIDPCRQYMHCTLYVCVAGSIWAPLNTGSME